MLRHSLLVAVCCLAAQAQAQTVAPIQQAPRSNGPLWYGQSSTLQEGVQHGFADVMRADGERTYDLSLAAGNFEDAREKWLKNSKLGVQTYFERKMMNQAYRQAMTGKSAAKSQSAPVKVTQASVETNPAPVLSNGQIEWPTALETSATAESRQTIETAFRNRSAGNAARLGSPEYRQACQALTQIRVELQGSIRSLPTAEYLAAKKVLKSLRHDLDQPTAAQMITQK